MESLIDRIKRHEGCRLTAYKDSLGNMTIGYGHLMKDGDSSIITQAEADDLLAADIATAEHGISVSLPWTGGLDDVRRGILVEMAFQMGIHRLLRFVGTLAAVKKGDYLEAAAHMLDSLWAQQTPNRALEMAQIMKTGVA